MERNTESLPQRQPVSYGAVFNFNPYNILAGLIFGMLGMASFSYGKSLDRWKPRVIGVALMFYSYLTPNIWLTWGIGLGLVVTLWFHHDE